MPADVTAYKVFGAEMQYVEITLGPQDAAVGEAGSMFFMENGIALETIFGDGSAAQSGFFGKVLGAGKRMLTGESLFTTVYTNQGQALSKVAFAAPYTGKIIPVNLAKMGGSFLCQKTAFLCGAKGVEIGIAFQKKLGVGFFGGEGFILQKLDGWGTAFLHAGGTVHRRDLAAGETLRVDTSCIVGLQPTVNYDIQMVPGIKTALFGGEGLFFATLTGPGMVLLQSLPIARLASRIFAAAPNRKNGGINLGFNNDEGAVDDFMGGEGMEESNPAGEYAAMTPFDDAAPPPLGDATMAEAALEAEEGEGLLSGLGETLGNVGSSLVDGVASAGSFLGDVVGGIVDKVKDADIDIDIGGD